MNRLTIDDLLRGTEPGRMQSVGHMQVVPLLGDDDDRFAAPEVEVRTSAYGTVELRHDGARPTIIPPGAGWVVEQAAQDHAIGGGVLLAGASKATITTARCIQRTQAGYIAAAKHPLLILPAALRAQALAIRRQVGFGDLWGPISEFNRKLGVHKDGHLDAFLRRFRAELDLFVAEFELVPRQVGALVLVGGQLAGVERAPSAGFWRSLWEPLIRVCYGSLALEHGQRGDAPPATRVGLAGRARTVAQLRVELALAKARERELVGELVEQLRGVELQAGPADQALGDHELVTLASERLAGQIVRTGERISYASLAATQLRSVERRASGAEAAGEAEPSSPAGDARCEPSAGPSWADRLRRWLLG